jgi:hypothetical protein
VRAEKPQIQMLDRTRKTFNAAGHAYQRTHDYVRHTRHFVRRLGAAFLAVVIHSRYLQMKCIWRWSGAGARRPDFATGEILDRHLEPRTSQYH